MVTKSNPPKASRTFADGICHHRDASGKPDCRKKIEGRGANLCPTHQGAWAKAARERAAARKASTQAVAKPAAKVVALADRKTTQPARQAHPTIAAMVEAEPKVTKVD